TFVCAARSTPREPHVGRGHASGARRDCGPDVRHGRLSAFYRTASLRPGSREHHASRCTRRGASDGSGDPRCGGGYGPHPPHFGPADSPGRPAEPVTPCTEQAHEWLESVAKGGDDN